MRFVVVYLLCFLNRVYALLKLLFERSSCACSFKSRAARCVGPSWMKPRDQAQSYDVWLQRERKRINTVSNSPTTASNYRWILLRFPETPSPAAPGVSRRVRWVRRFWVCLKRGRESLGSDLFCWVCTTLCVYVFARACERICQFLFLVQNTNHLQINTNKARN